MLYLATIIMGLVEGITEFLPISSTGHLVLTGHYLGFDGSRPGAQPGRIPAAELGLQVHALLSGAPVPDADPEALRLADVFRQSPLGRRAAQAGRVEREFDWIHRFDVRVWSYQLGVAKPDAAIYRHTLAELGVEPEETLFIDDKRVNVEAARALGIQAIEFSSVERLRADLIATGLDAEVPLPG